MNNTASTNELTAELINLTVAVQTIIELSRQLTGFEGREILARAKAHLDAQVTDGCIRLAEIERGAHYCALCHEQEVSFAGEFCSCCNGGEE